jgi:hypothetical protein
MFRRCMGRSTGSEIRGENITNGAEMIKKSGLVIIIIVTNLIPAYALGQTTPGFKTPSNNIFCVVEGDRDNDPIADLRCDMRQMSSAPLQKPEDCDFDWGDAFSIARDDNVGMRVCHSDTVMDDHLTILPYGALWRQGGFECKSEINGLTCVNAKGHGFMLSRAAQRLF